MKTKERELLRKIVDYMWEGELVDEIKELLAQPEQEPVAWMNESGSCFLSDGNKYSDLWTPLYTAPPKREPLSDLDVFTLYEEAEYIGFLAYRKGIKDAEKAHGITGGGE
jgi:hypothetical protein